MFLNITFLSSKNPISSLLFVLATLFILNVLGSCAKVGAPIGGPKDTIPPNIVFISPNNYSTRFTENEIEITFDEYIQLQNINDEIVVSPPLKETPEVILRYKTIEIELPDTLLDSITYTLNFGNAIVDNNEKNPLANYEYVFSTGPKLDSLSISGVVLNSFDLTIPEEKVFVMLYSNLADSAPKTSLPLYLAKVREKGVFQINNIREGTYRIFALQDANADFIYNLPNEQIAFIDTPLVLSPQTFTDLSLLNDTIGSNGQLTAYPTNDTSASDTAILADTLANALYKRTYGLHVELRMFDEKEPSQYLTGSERPMQYNFFLSFNEPYTYFTDSLSLSVTNATPVDSVWYIIEPSTNFDTLTYWITDSNIYKLDTLQLAAKYFETDSAQQLSPKLDTLLFRGAKTQKPTRGKKDSEKESADVENKMDIRINASGTFDHYKNLQLTSSQPIETIDTSRILFQEVVNDSTFIALSPKLLRDTLALRNYTIANKLEPAKNYSLMLPEGTFKSIYNFTHDTLEVKFKTREEDYYGTLIVNLAGLNQPLVLQFMNEKEEVIQEKYITDQEKLVFSNVSPGKYQLKAFVDRNQNKIWDTGNYDRGLQPEKVIYYDGEISIRSNWELEINWDLSKDLE